MGCSRSCSCAWQLDVGAWAVAHGSSIQCPSLAGLGQNTRSGGLSSGTAASSSFSWILFTSKLADCSLWRGQPWAVLTRRGSQGPLSCCCLRSRFHEDCPMGSSLVEPSLLGGSSCASFLCALSSSALPSVSCSLGGFVKTWLPFVLLLGVILTVVLTLHLR